MKTPLFAGTLAMTLLGSGLVAAEGTLEQVIERGHLNCGSHISRAGFASQDSNGNWHGFDVGFCRALAAAVLGDPSAVQFEPLTAQSRFDALTEGEVDVLARSTTWTFLRDVEKELTFVGTYYYDGQGFMVKREMGVSSALELDETTICIETGTTTVLNLDDYFRANGMSYEAVTVESSDDAKQGYQQGDCEVYTSDIAALASGRAGFADPGAHVILPEVISKEPLGLVVRHGDDAWADIVRWTLFALIAAEELGITSTNLEELKASSTKPEIRRLLGSEGSFGAVMGLADDWAARAIAAVGNYGELFASTIGDQTPIGLARGLNAQWTQGGLLYAPPFR